MCPGMVSEARLALRYGDVETAEAVLRATAPDNFGPPEGLEIDARREETELRITIRSAKGVGSLNSTIDDLLACISAAEKSIEKLR